MRCTYKGQRLALREYAWPADEAELSDSGVLCTISDLDLVRCWFMFFSSEDYALFLNGITK